MASFIPALPVFPITRDGAKLVIPVAMALPMALLPPVCVKCGAPADGKPVEKTFYWHPQWLYVLIFIGVLIYAIAALVMRKQMRVRVPLCRRHAERRSGLLILAGVLPVIGFADTFILPSYGVDTALVVLVVVAFILAGLVLWAVAGSPIRPTLIDQYQGIFTGCCLPFLLQFPEGIRN
jgi:phage shock protein PspC (stress-responsive transcriptional regulator)